MSVERGPDLDGTLLDVVERGSRVAATWLRRQMVVNPYATLGIGAFAGWVLGGGLSPALGGLVVRGAGRVMLADVAGAVVRGVADANGGTAG
jgi:outer membrane lipoprotein SlyB